MTAVAVRERHEIALNLNLHFHVLVLDGVYTSAHPLGAELMKRVFEIDVLVCPHCEGKRDVIAFLTDVFVVRKERFSAIAHDLKLPTLDARPALRAVAAEAEADGKLLYLTQDWHLNEHGNHVFARFLHDAFEQAGLLPAAFAATHAAKMLQEPKRSTFPKWIPAYAILWLVLPTLYALTYREEPWCKAALGVAVILGLVFTIAIGGGHLLKLVPPPWSTLLFVLVFTALLSFIVIKLGRRLTTIGELFTSFTRRGHWYQMPLVVVLLSIGSLLVVAASSPLIAPFIYTRF